MREAQNGGKPKTEKMIPGLGNLDRLPEATRKEGYFRMAMRLMTGTGKDPKSPEVQAKLEAMWQQGEKDRAERLAREGKK